MSYNLDFLHLVASTWFHVVYLLLFYFCQVARIPDAFHFDVGHYQGTLGLPSLQCTRCRSSRLSLQAWPVPLELWRGCQALCRCRPVAALIFLGLSGVKVRWVFPLGCALFPWLTGALPALPGLGPCRLSFSALLFRVVCGEPLSTCNVSLLVFTKTAK